ncbi:unnamed protein product [Chondrus crispus]|uniref:Uncharacterized protein n=1 Tax=Chondrus crispus TaxID=2769 RepID=R7QKZ2_CHOCR|nr:unnamed protein product [Chondrus crispus]CDF38050.1 unnamed protein product [Chondrus crispus]|eukprot:XP_005717919.1 unnamed protein product [Chondrus crispus]
MALMTLSDHHALLRVTPPRLAQNRKKQTLVLR